MAPAVMQTAEDLLRFREPGKTAELVRGVLIVRGPPGTGHGVRSARLLYVWRTSSCGTTWAR